VTGGAEAGTGPLEAAAPGGDLLGWDAFRRLLGRFAATPPGRERALALEPLADLAAARAALADTRDGRRALGAEGPPPWDGLGDVRPLLARAAPEGAVLDGPDLAALGRALGAAARLAAYADRLRGPAPDLAARWHALPLAPDLAALLAHHLDPDGRLRDDASPRLRALRRQVQALRADLQLRLERLLDSPALAPALQERYVTLRNGRYVVPVREDARRAVRGIVHDRSQSGATLFVEPEAVIDLNNQLTQRALEERAEEQRILRDLTGRVREARPALEALVDGLAGLDLLFARAALAERLDAVEPALEEDGDLDLPAARHPLLAAQRWGGPAAVVPVDLRLPAARPALLISGPNAGGKTVALETCGLLVLMAHAGCHLPAGPGSRVPRCEAVLAVIGDEQSLARDLSTFSSFVAQVRGILERAGPRTLVLLDELGAGTDPAEGAALGAALVEALVARGARVLATTHLEPLKVFAQLDPAVENATVAFDAERLEPTFRLEYGRPGPSYALTIAARLGLPAPVLDRARVHLSEASRRLEALIADLEAREREAGRRLAEAAGREAEARAALARAREETRRAEAEAATLRREARAEAGRLLADARRQVGHELDRLKAAPPTRREVQQAYQRLREAEAGLPAAPAAAPAGGPGPAAGEVQVRGLGLRGRVVAEEDDTVTVQAGRLTVRVARAELEPAAPGATPPPAGRPAAAVEAAPREDVPREIYLLGLVTDEARVAVEKYLDDAALAGHHAVRLIHGKGTGALRRTVERCLRGHPLVSAYRTAPAAEGGEGVTVVELAEDVRP
jgi:DNA mismatch repair protein MutS2